MKPASSRLTSQISRRDVFRSAGIASTAGLLSWMPATAAAVPPKLEPPPHVYTRLRARPFINCTATVTVNGGSRLLPQVIEAIEQASYYHVNLDQLMEAAGKRISKLLQVQWAMVSCGAAAALTHATAACVAGTDPELMQQLPDLTGLKNEVIMPKSSRNQYDHAVRAVGVRTIEVDSLEEFKAAINNRTAMISILGNRFENVTLGLKEVAPIANKAGVPILVDAAADYLIVPNPYIAEGADLVAYSGGKILRGPQTAGLLIGREDLVRAAFAHSSPHHALGRPMKVSKEEIVGMVTAVEVWVNKRNLKAEYQEWEGWYQYITKRITQLDGVTTSVRPPSRGGPFPTLWIEWDPRKIGLTARELRQLLLNREPSIMTHAQGDGHGFLLRPVAMKPQEYKVVTERLHDLFRKAPRGDRKPSLAAPTIDVSGRWDVEVKFTLGESHHLLFLQVDGNDLTGTHVGTRVRGELRGTIDGAKVRFRSMLPFEGSKLRYSFEGTVSGHQMTGTLDLAEYPQAGWIAHRYDHRPQVN